MTDSLSQFAFDSIIIIGHTDSTGDETLNKQLSSNRAHTIATYFKKANVKTSTLRTEGKGSSVPLKSNSTESGRTLNRRVEILFYHKRP